MIQTNNKLIAEFMGIEEAYNPNGNDWVLKKTTPDVNGDTDILESCKGNELQYHTSWDRLMPVVQKIEQDCEGVPQYMLNISLYSDINEVYNAVIEFIKNQNN